MYVIDRLTFVFLKPLIIKYLLGTPHSGNNLLP